MFYTYLKLCFAAIAFFGAFALSSSLYAQAPCATTVECAQKAVDAAAKTEAAVQAVQAQLDALKQQVDALKVKSSGTPAPNQKDDTGRLASEGAASFPLRCEAGQVAVGVNLILGGTCHEQCNGDGRPVQQFKLVCQTLEIAK